MFNVIARARNGENMLNRGGLKIHFDYSSFRIDPKGLMNMRLKIPFKAGGVVDFEALYQQMLDGMKYNLGKEPNFTTEKHQKLRRQLADTLVKKAIQTRDVLESFDPDGDPYWGADWQIHIPLRMQGSGRKLDLRPAHKSDGRLDRQALVDSFEGSYKEVLSGVTI